MLWGSRFQQSVDQDVFEFTKSIFFDKNLFKQEIRIDQVYAEMLEKIGILSQEEKKLIKKGLNELTKKWDAGFFVEKLSPYEDIHSLIETELKNLIGETAEKIHTGRSRNDLSVTSLRMWVKDYYNLLIRDINSFINTLTEISDKNVNLIMPGYTHLQRAQPVSLAFHFCSYIEMAERDKTRVLHSLDSADELPLGSAALAGSTLSIDRGFMAKKLGFKKISKIALDAVSDRDFVMDLLHNNCLIMLHLSRLAEEIILWSTKEWNFATISDSFTTGSSLMPQKKNPDVLELIRGRAGIITGNYVSMNTVLKALPLSYNRDLQEDKRIVFQSCEITKQSLVIFNELLKNITFNKNRFLSELESDTIMATDLVDWLVTKGMTFRTAHSKIGEIIKICNSRGIPPGKIKLSELKKIDPLIDNEYYKIIKVEFSLERKKTAGSPNPSMILEYLKSKKNQS